MSQATFRSLPRDTTRGKRRLTVGLTNTPAEIVACQRLRYEIFSKELGAIIKSDRLSAVAEAMSSILDRLRCGQRVVIFPEGTTTEGTSVLAFHSALFQAAIGAKCAVQAVALRYMRDGRPDPEAAFVDDDAFIPHLLKVLSTRTTEIHLHWCEALAVGHHSRRRLALHTRSQILAILEHKFWRGAA